MKLEFGLEIKNQCKRCGNFKFYIEMDANHFQHKKYYCDVTNSNFFHHSVELTKTICRTFRPLSNKDKKL